ncbi:MAG: glycosyltransferase family 1 protein [Caulobacterales bacterium]
MAPPTGVHRVAEQLILALDELLGLDSEIRQRWDIELFAPRRLHHTLSLAHIPFRQGGVFTHIPWEQFDLPYRAMRNGAMIVGFCNLGPVIATNAVTMIHDAQVYLSPESYSKPFRLWYKTVQPLLGKRHTRILAVSDYSRTQLANARVARLEKTTVLHNGADHILSMPADQKTLKALNLAPGSFVLGRANTQPHKNVRVLIKAFADPRLIEKTLVLFGAANREAFEAAIGASIPSNVVFAGKVSDGELRALMESALCLAFPSTTEGFGLPPLEAMAVGCPVICAPCGALPEVCGDAVMYADADSPDAWVEGILSLAVDQDRRRNRIEAGLKHADQFKWLNVAKRLITLLDATPPVR